MPQPAPGNTNLIRRLFEDLRLLLRLIGDYSKGRYRDVSPTSAVVFILAVAYVLLPTDLIGDFIPGLGQIDDAALFLGCLYYLEKDLYRYRDWKDGKGRN
jgi:uncharacterized membrane protein YkvA (DUF1232 family)